MIDGTLDGGGHAREILKRIMPRGMFLGIDWDKRMIERFQPTTTGGARTILVHDNYVNLPKILRARKLRKADGLLLDLGFSSEQLEESGRGFSFLKDEPLLMTYDDQAEPAYRVLQKMNAHELTRIIGELGGEKFARRIAQAIVGERRKKPIRTSGQLAEIVRHAVPQNYERGRINPATRTFQALRIYVNDELGNLERVLDALPDIIAPGGRVAVISFHSLEDKLVKNALRTFAREEKFTLLTKKPVSATLNEIRANPRSRSAKLRVAIQNINR